MGGGARRQQQSKRQWLTSPPKRAREDSGHGHLELAGEDEPALEEGCVQQLFPEAHQEPGRKGGPSTEEEEAESQGKSKVGWGSWSWVYVLSSSVSKGRLVP